MNGPSLCRAKGAKDFVCYVAVLVFSVAAALFSSNAEGQTMNSPKADCENLMNSVLPFAEQMLTNYGEFIPFGGAMKPNGQIVSAAGYDGSEHPQSVDVIALMKSGFVDAARKGEYLATAIVYDVKVTLPSNQEKSDAIAVSLNHRDNYSIIVLFPYKIESGHLVMGAAFTQKGEADIFQTR